MKRRYEKPVAIRLGDAAKGSGACTVGSAVVPGPAPTPGGCSGGSSLIKTVGINPCWPGGVANYDCSQGNMTPADECNAGLTAGWVPAVY
jgi:hypothetical protein